MTRITCIFGGTALLAAFNCIAASPLPAHSHARPVTSPIRSAPVIVRPVIVGYAPSYYPSRPLSYPSQSRAVPPLSYIPPASPDAPPFSMSGSPAVEGWHWQRVSLQQIDAEVRAKRAAAGARAD